MDDLIKDLSAELDHDLGMKLKGVLPGNGSPAKTRPRVSERIDLLIGDLNVYIQMLQRLKESL